MLNLNEKWGPVLESNAANPIIDAYRKEQTAKLLENTQKALTEEKEQLQEAAPGTSNANVAKWDPILISLVRRSMPNLIAFDIASVQAMNGPTSLVFAMKSIYGTTAAGVNKGDEALFNEAATGFSGGASGSGNTSNDPFALDKVTSGSGEDADTVADYTPGTGGSTTWSEDIAGTNFNEMGFKIEKTSVTAKSRQLKAEYSMEVAQDLRAIHNLDAESELANILSAEITAEINREIIRTVNQKAIMGAQHPALTAKTGSNTGADGEVKSGGIFDLNTDADGRWSKEKYNGLVVQLQREANMIAKTTRRGKGNFILCSSDVAAALAATGLMDYQPALSKNANLSIDDTGATFAGVISGSIKVYIDPYAGIDYITIGYKGSNQYDAGLFYCPYVPLTMVRAVGENSFQPKIGFKTRYGLIANPFAGGAGQGGSELGTNRQNMYFRIFKVDNILA